MNLISKEKSRLSRRFINFFWFLSLCFMTHAQTSIIISGDLSEDEQVTTFDALRKITWSSEGIGEDPQKNHPPEPFEDVKRVQEYLDANHITATAAYVPTTVWDLYFIYKYFKDPTFKESCTSMVKKGEDKKGFPKIYFQVSQELSNRMRVHREEGSQKDLPFFTRFGEEILELIATELSGESKWVEALICEHEKFKNDKGSLILEMIRQEYQAAEKNQILLVRATNGLPLLSKISTEQEYRDRSREYYTKYYKDYLGIRSPELEEKVEKKVNEMVEKDYQVKWFQSFEHVKWFQSFEHDQRALDFPLKGGFHEDSAYEGIHTFNEGKKGDVSNAPCSIDLSYATSLLGGYLYDGFNGSGKSACSFVYFIYYVQNPNLTLYTLSLDKKWFFTEGTFFFHVRHSPLEGIVGYGRDFHPRLRAMLPSFVLNKELRDSFSNNLISTNYFKLDDSFDWGDFNERIKEYPEKKKIFQYILEANEILVKASILSLGGELTARGGFVAEKAKQMIEHQKRCSEVLIKKCSEES